MALTGNGHPILPVKGGMPVRIESGGRNRVVAMVGKKVVGAASAWEDSRNEFVILKSEVKAPYRRRGVATAMYRAIEAAAGKQLKPAVSLSDDAFEFWKRYRPDAVAKDLRHRQHDLLGAKAWKDGRVGTIIEACGGIATIRYDDAAAGSPNSQACIHRDNLDAAITEVAERLASNARINTSFGAWFGRSKVVYPNGLPRKVFHGRSGPFVGGTFGSGDSIEGAIFFTDSPAEASWYATGGSGEVQGVGEHVMPVYLAIQNPYVINLKGALDYESYRIPDAIAAAKKQGCDGLIVHNAWNGNEGTGAPGIANETQYVVFEATQIKSAIGNNGDFSTTNSDVLFSIAEDPAAPELDSPFDAWFGGSKVVEDDGTPKRMYHGTTVWEASDGRSMGDFSVFDRMWATKVLRRQPGVDTVGSWFSDTPGMDGAGMYAGQAIYPVYLAIKNPWTVTFEGLVRTGNRLMGRPLTTKLDGDAVERLRAWMADIGADGINIKHDDWAENRSTEFKNQDAWIALEPHQIKSAVGNNGAFDRANPDIRFSVSDPAPADPMSSPAFRRWFGLSVITDVGEAGGKPLVVYHGTAGTSLKDVNGSLFWVALSQELAETLNGRSRRAEAVYVKADRPFDPANEAHVDSIAPALDKLYENSSFNDWRRRVAGHWKVWDDPRARQAVQDAGFDAIWSQEDGNPTLALIGDVSGRVKSAAGNNGEFSALSNDIRFSTPGADEVVIEPPATTKPQFQRWFGNSQGVDSAGSPMVMFHGTNAEISVFEPGLDGGIHFGTASQANMRASGAGKNLIPAYLAISNVRRSKDLGGKWKSKIESAKSAGHDGIVYLNRYEGISLETVLRADAEKVDLDALTDAKFRQFAPEAQDSYIVFKPGQIRSAIGNGTEFSRSSADIKYSGTPGAAPSVKRTSTIPLVEAAVREMLGGLELGAGLGKVVVTTSAEIKSTWEPLLGKSLGFKSEGVARRVQGFHEPASDTVFLIADNIELGQEAAISAHEFMHKHGPTVLGQEGWDRLHGVLNTWANARAGTAEKAVYDQARAKVLSVGLHLSSQEMFPYAVEAAYKMGIRPTHAARKGSVASWLSAVKATLQQVWRKISTNPQELTAQDLVNLAFGIAQMETPEGAITIGDALAPRIWRSALEEGISALPVGTAPASGWMSEITELIQKGVAKAAEVEWSGVTDWLKMQTGKVSKVQVLTYLEKNAARSSGLARYAAGEAAEKIATDLGVGATTVRRWIAWAGIGRSAAETKGVTQQLRKQALQLYKDGLSVARVAEQTGLGGSTIHRIVTADGSSRSLANTIGHDSETKNDAISLYILGLNTYEVADQVGVNQATVASWMVQAGVSRGYSDAQALRVALGRNQNNRGIQAEFTSAKGGGTLPTASVYELARMHQLEADPEVVTFKRSSDRIPYGDGKHYVPDIEVTLRDGTVHVEEVKPEAMLQDDVVRQKAEAALAFYGEREKQYRLVTERHIGQTGFDLIKPEDYPGQIARIKPALATARWAAREIGTAFDITPEMRLQTAAGLPMFSLATHPPHVFSAFHGTDATFTEFDTSEVGELDRRRLGAYFSASERFAATYGPQVIPVQIVMAKPFDVTGLSAADAIQLLPVSSRIKMELNSAFKGDDYSQYALLETASRAQLRSNLEADGFDGIKYTEGHADAYIAFDKAQIKPAVRPAPPQSPGEAAAAFQAWFDGSQVVTATGTPRRMFHGTTADFNVFGKTKDIGFHFGTVEQAHERFGRKRNGRNIIPVYLNIKKPLRLVEDPRAWMASYLVKHGIPDEVFSSEERGQLMAVVDVHLADARAESEAMCNLHGSKSPEAEWIPILNTHNSLALSKLREALEAKGYDGLVYTNKYEGTRSAKEDSWVAFRPSQIKSATGNSFEYNPGSDDIRFSMASANEHGGGPEYHDELIAQEMTDDFVHKAVQTMKRMNAVIAEAKGDDPSHDTNTQKPVAIETVRKSRKP